MKKLLIAIVFISSFLISQSLTKGWLNDDFEVPGALITETFEVLGGTPAIGKVLTDDGTGAGVAVWSAPTGGLTDPMTTRGDIIYRDPTNVTARLGLGANLFILQSDGTDAAWSEFLASEMNIVDAGSKIIATEVEAALQENRTASDLNTSLLNVTPGTATASKALVVDANKDIDLDTGDLDANIGVFDGTLTTNSNYVVEGEPGQRAIFRGFRLSIADGTNANTLKASMDFNWNSTDEVTTDNVAKGATTGNYTLSADGLDLTIDSGALDGTVDEVFMASMDANNSGTYYTFNSFQLGGEIVVRLLTVSGVMTDITAVVDAGTVRGKIVIVTTN